MKKIRIEIANNERAEQEANTLMMLATELGLDWDAVHGSQISIYDTFTGEELLHGDGNIVCYLEGDDYVIDKFIDEVENLINP